MLQKNVVVTHHGPSPKSVAAEFQNDLTTAYVSPMETLIKKYTPTYWMLGDDLRLPVNHVEAVSPAVRRP